MLYVESEKYKGEVYKIWGMVCSTPFGLFFKELLSENAKIDLYSSWWIFGLSLKIAMFILGISLTREGYRVIYNIEAKQEEIK